MGRVKKKKPKELCTQCKNPNQKGICTCGGNKELPDVPLQEEVIRKQCSMCPSITEYHYLVGRQVYCLDCCDKIISWVVNKYREDTGK